MQKKEFDVTYQHNCSLIKLSLLDKNFFKFMFCNVYFNLFVVFILSMNLMLSFS